jgi:hypothetical protein
MAMLCWGLWVRHRNRGVDQCYVGQVKRWGVKLQRSRQGRDGKWGRVRQRGEVTAHKRTGARQGPV